MVSEKHDAEELLDDPMIGLEESGPVGETPFNQTVDMLSRTRGPELELMCRMNRPIAEAATVCYAMVAKFHCDYLIGRMDQIMRLSVSNGGLGREEMVRSLQAGSGVPGEYYESQSATNQGFIEDQ